MIQNPYDPFFQHTHRFLKFRKPSVTRMILEGILKDIRTQDMKQVILRFEMSIKRTSSDVGFLYNVLHGDVTVAFMLQQNAERSKNRLSGFLLPPVEKIVRSFGLTSIPAFLQTVIQ